MAKYHVDRDTEYMYKMWGTTSLITDYWTKPAKQVNDEDVSHNFTHQNEIHSQIRNDDDYDDWEYGTEPIYGCPN